MQREMYQSEEMEYCGGSPMWDQDEAGEVLEDPFVVLGRYVKGAGKNLWKNIRPKKDGRIKTDAAADSGGEQEMEKETVTVISEEEPDSSASGDSSEDSSKSSADEQPIPLPDGRRFDWPSVSTRADDTTN
jgi:hypothetical protein